jgi:hypothetical protein
MQFPDDVLSIIKEFSRPVTRPDWRTLHRVPSLRLHLEIALLFNMSINMATVFFIKTQTSDYIYYIEYESSGPYVRYLVADNSIYKIDKT